MLRHITLGVASAVAVVVLVITLFIGYSVAAPFFEEMGDEKHESIGNVSGNGAINMGGGLAFVGLSLLAVPGFLLMRYMFAGGGGRRQQRVRRRRP